MRPIDRSQQGPLRRGVASLLVLVSFIVALCLPVLVARHSQGGRARATVAHGIATSLVVSAGRSALAEAWWELERRSVEPGRAAFEALRARERGSLRGTVPVVRTVRALAGDPALAACTVEKGEVRVKLEAPRLEGPVFGELSCRATLEAAVRHELTGVSRVLAESRDIRVSLLAVPPPFDALPVVVVDAAALVPPLANAWMDESAKGMDAIRAIPAKLRAEGRGSLAAALSSLEALEAAPAIGSLVTDPLHHFPANLSLASFAASVGDLSSLDLRPRLRAARERVVSADARARDASPNEALARLTALHAEHRALLEVVRSYEESWVEYSGEAADWLRESLGVLDPGLWRERATFRFEGPGAARRFLATLDGFAREARPRGLHGIVYVDDPTETLVLEGRSVGGQLAICCTGAVRLSEVRRADPVRDRLVVQGAEVSVRGRVEAAVVARGEVVVAPGAVIAGQLVLPRVPRAPLAGQLEADRARYDSRAEGVEDPRFLHAAFAPWSAKRELDVR